MPKELKKYLLQTKSLVEKELDSFLTRKSSLSSPISKDISIMIDIIKDYTLRGGKRIRAALLYNTYLCYSKKNLKEIIKAAAAIELLQSYLLIHDDFMDNDDLRRGGPTVHKTYHSLSKDLLLSRSTDKEKEHFSYSMSVLAGDLAESFCREIMSDLQIDPIKKIKALKKLSSTTNTVIYGQLLDIYSSFKKDFTESDLLKIHHYKTASYTIESPMHLGAVLAGAKDKELKLISDYAIPLGLAFQLKDDILGIFGTEEKLGKPMFSDIREGKKTLLILKALEKASKKDSDLILSSLGNPALTDKQGEKIRSIIIDTGSLRYSEDLMQKFINSSIRSIKRLSKFKKRFFIDLAHFIADRDY